MLGINEELRIEYINYFKKITSRTINDKLYNILNKFAAFNSNTTNYEHEIDIAKDILKKPITNTYVDSLSIYNYIEHEDKKRIAFVINSDDIYEDEKNAIFSKNNEYEKENYLKYYKNNLLGLGYLKRVANIEIFVYVYYKEEHKIDIPSCKLSWVNDICDCVGIEPNHIYYFSNKYLEYFINKVLRDDINKLPFNDIKAIGNNVNVFSMFDNITILKDLMLYLKEGIEKKTLKKLINEYVNYKVNILKLQIKSIEAIKRIENVKEQIYKYLLYTSRLTHAMSNNIYYVCYCINGNGEKVNITQELFWDRNVVKIDYTNFNISLNECYKASETLDICKGYNNKNEFQIYI